MYMGKYPEPISVQSGCKVGYLIYKNKRIALEAAEIARVEGERLERAGYEFGFQIPGEIVGKRGWWMVTIP